MGVDMLGFILAGSYSAFGVVEAVDNSSLLQLGASVVVGGLLGYGAYLNSRDPPRPLFQLSTELLMTGIMGTRYRFTGEVNHGALFIATAASVVYNSYMYADYLEQQIDFADFVGRDSSRRIFIKIPDIRKHLEE